MRKENVISIQEARKSLNRNFKLNVHSGWAGTTQEFLITNICRSKLQGKIDIKGKGFHYLVTEQEFNKLTRYGHFENTETVDGCTFTNRVKLVVAPKPVKFVKISVYGGFHNAKAKNVIIREDDYNDLVKGEMTLEDTLSETQLECLERHLCGVEGCTCGGIRRASWTEAKPLKL